MTIDDRFPAARTDRGRTSQGLRARWAEGPVEWTLFFLLLAGLAWAPLWLGSNRLIPWGINAVLFGGAAILYEVSILLRGERHPIGLKTLRVPTLLFVPVVLWIFIQNSVLVPGTLVHPVWGMTAETLNRPVAGSISVNRDLTTLALMRLLTSISVLWLSIQLCRNVERAHLLLRTVGWIGAAYAVYGLVAFASFNGAILWFDEPSSGHFVRSTFVNRNNFSTYAGICLIANTATLLRLYRHEVRKGAGSLGRRLSLFIEATGRRGWFLAGTGFVTLAALLLSGSRAGIASTTLGLFSFFLLSTILRNRSARDRIEAIVFVALSVVACFFFLGDVLVGRISEDGLVDQNRLSVYAITADSILDAPFLGFGYGTFADVFPLYRDRSIEVAGLWDRAHNTYLEVFQGLGLVAGSMLIASVAVLVYKSFMGVLRRRQGGTCCCVAVAGALLVGTHALVDFSLQIQAVALTFMALLGAGVAQCESSTIRHL